jgi:hypothetical protein
MPQTIDREELRDWIIDRIEKDARGARDETPGADAIYDGRIDALVMLGTDFDLWPIEARDWIADWVESPKDRRLRDVLDK